jgi:2-desacetyl-2-hydroxyethyl bacteriochlorophyllide A dehydrogenase
MQAKAAVARKPCEVMYQPVSLPQPGANDLVIDVEYSWISNGTDGSFVRGERIAGDTPRLATDPLPFPHVPGYQKAGVVSFVGPAVKDFKVGDRVFATVSQVEGMFYPTGGHVNPALTSAGQVWPVPDRISLMEVSGLVLAQVGYNCAMRPPIRTGDKVLVLGDGLVGHWAAQVLAWRGANPVMLGHHASRLALAAEYNYARTILTKGAVDLAELASIAPDGYAALIATAGSVADIEELYPLLQQQAHLVSAGFYGSQGRIDIQQMRAKELTLHAPSGWNRARMDQTMLLLAKGRLKTLPLISHVFPAAEASQAFTLILEKKEAFLGVVLDWRERR